MSWLAFHSLSVILLITKRNCDLRVVGERPSETAGREGDRAVMVGINEQINNVLMRVYKRAENLDTSLLEDTFVPIVQVDGMLSMAEHHVLYGRRGTGKTHTLRRRRSSLMS